MPEQTQGAQAEVDDKGVPLTNRIKEMERKLEEKYGAALESTMKELEEMKAWRSQIQQAQAQEDNQNDDTAKAALAEFVKDPRRFVSDAISQTEFQRQIPEAEKWITSQNGYTKDDDARIFQIIKENKLDTPYHSPMERARTAWRLLESDRLQSKSSAQTDEDRREAALKKSETENSGKSISKEKTVTRKDLIMQLADAEAKGDLDKAIALTSMLEDVR